MEIFSFDFLSALISIIIIDLVLAGDNAIVIGLAARNLPKAQQKKVILLGTAGAVVMRILATLAVVWLLKIPGLLLIGGLLLLWIAFKLLIDDKDHEEDVEAADNMWAAIRTIIIADTVMGLDNVLAVAGAAHSNYLLVILGLLISVPIVIWGSTIFLKLLERFPWVLYVGAGVLAFTAAKMVLDEQFIKVYIANDIIKYIIIAVVVTVVLLAGKWAKSLRSKKEAKHA